MNQRSPLPDEDNRHSPLAAVLAVAIAGARGSRVPVDVLRGAALGADLSLAGAPDGRVRIRAAIDELAADGTVILPKGVSAWDASVLPSLPAWVSKPRDTFADRAEPVPRRTWHAALGWAAAGGWSATDERVLIAINDWLIAGGPTRKVPLQERSLEITGEEKLLGQMLRGPLFAKERLTLDLLGAERTSPPFVFTKIGAGPVALVVENSATYRTLTSEARGSELVGVVAFGGGNGFSRSVEFFAELADSGRLDGPITDIRYFDDLDPDGLRIPAAASRLATELGLPPVLPAVGLYRRLRAAGHPAVAESLDPAAAAALAAWLPGDLAGQVADLLERGQRMAQEAVGRDLLAGDPSWATV